MYKMYDAIDLIETSLGLVVCATCVLALLFMLIQAFRCFFCVSSEKMNHDYQHISVSDILINQLIIYSPEQV